MTKQNKRILSTLLALVLSLAVFSLAGCAQKPTNGSLRTGYAERDYGPLSLEHKMGLAGYDNDSKRITQSIDSYGLDIEALAVKDVAGNVAVICSVEAVTIATDFHTALREAVEVEYQVPKSNIIITSNHQHSTPNIGISIFSTSSAFNADFKKLFLEAVGDALAQLETEAANTIVRTTTAQTDGLNYVRNTKVYGIADDEYRGMVCTDNHVDPGVTKDWDYYFVAEEGAGDKDLQLVWFDRAELKDIVLANFSTHPHAFTGGSGGTTATSGFTGEFRDLVSGANDCYTMYISGASGDMGMTTTSTVIQTMVEKGSKTKVTAQQPSKSGYATKMASYVPKLETESGTWTTQEAYQVETKAELVTLQRNNEKQELLSLAQQISSGGEATRKNLMGQYTSHTERGSYIYSVLHAREIIRRSQLPETMDLDVYAISIGDVSFAGVPYEMFSADGVYVKTNNSHKMTIMATLANGHNGYIPSTEHWGNGGYSCDITKYAQGASDTINQKLVEMLNGMAGN